ncbi:peptidase M24, structural domain-containing protein [Phycomyces nitens]|nr:peptidase M24, structural domain-containing protein [Phycomyces nitens]
MTDPASLPRQKRIPTRHHCYRVGELLGAKNERTIIYHRGGIDTVRDTTDVELDFRQESYFFYLSGVEHPGFHILIDLYNDIVYLIPPTVPDSEILWKGEPDTVEELLEIYDADKILAEEDVPDLIQSLRPELVYVLDTVDTSMIKEAGVRECQLDKVSLRVAMDEARLIKFPWEIELIRYAAQISSHAHMALMQRVQAGQPESYCEALFRWVCARNGMPRQCYIPIIASGPRAATLHYTRNNKLLPAGKHAMLLVDAGGERFCYGSDVTRTFPISGKFSPEAKTIYEIVLKMQETILSQLKPGAMWAGLHNLGVYILCQELIRIGILVGGTLEEFLRLGLPRAFYFHGTGHSVGLDVHDVGGRSAGVLVKGYYETMPRSQLLFSRPLIKDMVLTVEPGLYFNPTSIAMWTEKPGYAKYFNMEMINKYMPVGGVRIEDTVVLTEDGYDNLTIAPKTVNDIEALMACRAQSYMDSMP